MRIRIKITVKCCGNKCIIIIYYYLLLFIIVIIIIIIIIIIIKMFMCDTSIITIPRHTLFINTHFITHAQS